jgi:Secretion system C-terminal sorting domain
MKHLLLAAAGHVLLYSLLLVTHADAQCTASGPLGTTTGANKATVGTLAWTGTGNTATLNGSYATAQQLVSTLGTVTTEYLAVSNFGFSIPNTNTICGISATIYRANTSLISLGGSVSDNSVILTTAGALTGSDRASGTNWPNTTITAANYGSPSDLWGTTVLPTDINNPGFGIAVSANIRTTSLGVIPVAAIDQITLTVYSSPPIVLAVDLASFTVEGSAAGNVLHWTAAKGEVTNSFVIQRSADGVSWQDLATIAADAGQASYTYADAAPLTGQNFYRLKMLNADSSTAGYSVVATIITQTLSTTRRLYPNPFIDMINIASPTPFSRVIIRDALGRTLQVREFGSGINSAQIPAASLPAGLYFVQVDAITYKLIKN